MIGYATEKTLGQKATDLVEQALYLLLCQEILANLLKKEYSK